MTSKEKDAAREAEKDKLGEQSPGPGEASGSASAAVPPEEFPSMPLRPKVADQHRSHIPNHEVAISALVARSVPKKERNSNPKAKAAVDVEWGS